MSPSLLYRVLKIYCRAGLWFYFLKWQVKGWEKVPASGPLIFVANHQNAFLDAILMTCSSSRNPFYLARANVFKKKWAAFLLSLIRLMPIYRFRDGYNTLKNNDVILQQCTDLLKQGETILIFAEGNHNEPWSVGEFQKGLARLAMYYRQHTGDRSLMVVPIGLHYTNHHGFNTRILVQFGEPVLVEKVLRPDSKERENLEALTEVVRQKILELVLNITPKETYEAKKEYLMRNRKYKHDLVEQREADQEVLNSFPAQMPQQKKKQVLFWLAIPNTLYLYLTHGLLKGAIQRLINKKVSDPQFTGSVRFAVGIFLVPAYYGLMTTLFYWVTRDTLLAGAFLCSLPLSLLIGKHTLAKR